MKKPAALDQMTQAATHPIGTGAYVFGLVRGLGAELIRTIAGEPNRRSQPGVESRRPDLHPVPAAPQRPPAEPRESFATEPTAVSRSSAHGHGGNDAEIDDWQGDAELDLDPSADPATGSVVEALERGDRPGDDQIDHTAVKAVLSEAERARRTS